MSTPTNPPAKHPPPREECEVPDEILLEVSGLLSIGDDYRGGVYARRNVNRDTEHENVYFSGDRVAALLQEERKRAFEEAAKEVDAWLDLLEVDHRDIIAKQQYKDPQEAGREYRNKCNLLGAVRASILKKAQAARPPGDAEKGE